MILCCLLLLLYIQYIAFRLLSLSLQNAALSANSILHVMPMKTNMSLCSF